MPQVSVVIPSFNCATYLGEAIASVLAQSLSDFEIIVVDDGSTDDTRKAVQCFLTDSRVKYLYQDNAGLPAARNAGVRQAHGEFIAALDADDLLDPTALKSMFTALKNSGASWCMIDILKFWENFTQVQHTRMPKGSLRTAIFHEDFIRRAMFIRTAALKRLGMWDPEMKMREDWDLNIRLIEANEPHAYLEQPLYLYRKRPGSITTGSPGRLFYYTEQVLRKHHKRQADLGDRTLAKLYAENMWDLSRQHLYREGNLRAAVRCAKESLAYEFKPSRLFHPILHNVVTRLSIRSHSEF